MVVHESQIPLQKQYTREARPSFRGWRGWHTRPLAQLSVIFFLFVFCYTWWLLLILGSHQQFPQVSKVRPKVCSSFCEPCTIQKLMMCSICVSGFLHLYPGCCKMVTPSVVQHTSAQISHTCAALRAVGVTGVAIATHGESWLAVLQHL